MEIATGLLILAVGMIAGSYGTIVGAGGGFIFVPALLLLLHIDPVSASASGIVIVFINSLSAVVGYAKQNKINYRTGMFIGIGAFPGSILGVWLLQLYSSSYFYIIFATILVALGIFLFAKNSPFKILQKQRDTSIKMEADTADSALEIEARSLPLKGLLPLGFIMGVLSSYLGIGGGWLLVPVLIYFFKVPTHYATATSIFALALYSIIGVAAQFVYNNIEWMTVLWGGIGVMIGSQIGIRLSERIPSKMIMQMLSILLIIIGLRMFFA